MNTQYSSLLLRYFYRDYLPCYFCFPNNSKYYLNPTVTADIIERNLSIYMHLYNWMYLRLYGVNRFGNTTEQKQFFTFIINHTHIFNYD